MADAEAISFLQKQVAADGSSLYGHLTRVLAKVRLTSLSPYATMLRTCVASGCLTRHNVD